MRFLLRPHRSSVPIEPEPFRLYRGRKTEPPIVVPYLIFANGTLQPTVKQAVHYIKLRPFVGRNDSVLRHLTPDRKVLVRDLVEAERREIEQALWQNLFAYPPTHVLHFGWRSRLTGNIYRITYLPLNFFRPGFSLNGLAKSSVAYLAEWVQRCDDAALLRPTQKLIYNPITETKRSGTHFAAMFWLGQLFYYLKEETIESPGKRWN